MKPVIIEFSNAVPPKGQSAVSVAIVIASCAFFFIPTTLIILGYLSSRPTGTLISPLPQGVLSDAQPVINSSPAPIVTVTPQPTQAPIIAAPNDATATAQTNMEASSSGNIIDKTATLPAGQTEITVQNPEIKPESQIYLSPRSGDKTIYTVKNKLTGQATISANGTSDTVRYIDYHIVNP